MKLLSCCLALNLLIFWCILLSFSSSSRSAQRQWRYELRHERHKNTKWFISETDSAAMLVAKTTNKLKLVSLLGVRVGFQRLVDGRCWTSCRLQNQQKYFQNVGAVEGFLVKIVKDAVHRLMRSGGQQPRPTQQHRSNSLEKFSALCQKLNEDLRPFQFRAHKKFPCKIAWAYVCK